MLPRFSLLTLALIHIQTASADVYPTDYHSRVTGQFLTGHDQQLSGFVDGMVPVFKGSERFLFADGALMFGRDQRSVYSGGLGYRGIFNGPIGSGVGGAYVFGDYYHSSYSTTQWFLNPGLEWLGVSYEARLQAYVPLNSQNKVYGNTLASNLPANVVTSSGQPSNLSGATGHRVFDTPVNLIEEYGPGGEIEIGRLFDVGKGIWFRVGGYHFSYQDLSNVNGVQANVEGIISRNISVILQNNYDNQNKNRFSIGVRISFGGSEAPMNSLDYRLTTPIIRHQARQSYGQVEPTWQTYKASGPSFDVFGGTSGRAGGWFFSPKGSAPPGSATTLESCTAEHPCRTIDSATAARIQQLEAGANLLFETGTYSIPKDSSNNFNWVNLQDGQSVLGRNPGWVTAASTSNRPAIEGGVFWGDASAGDSANGILRDTNVLNSNQRIPGSTTGLGIDSVIAAGAAGNFTVSKSNAAAEATQEGYIHAVGLFSGNNLTVSNSEQEVTVTSLNDLTEAYGLLARNTATVNDSSETIAAAGQSALLFGISADSVNANNVTQTITGTANSGTLTAKGISANNLVTANKANIAITASSESDVSVFGIDSGGSALIENSILDVESASNTKAQSNGINTVGDTTINNVEVKALAEAEMETLANGINAGGDATVTGGSQDAQANAQSVSALANGISANNLTAMNTSSTATATLATTTESENSAQAVGMSSINKMTVSDSSTTGTATVDSGNGFAQVYGMSSGGDLKATNIIQHSTSTTASGQAIASGIEVQTKANVENLTQTISTTSTDGTANSRGIGADQITASMVNSKVTAIVTANTGGAESYGFFATTEVTADNITQEIAASTFKGNALAVGLQTNTVTLTGTNNQTITTITGGVDSPGGVTANSIGVFTQGGTITGLTQNISASGLTEGNATGISSTGDVTVSKGFQTITAESSGGFASSTGISSSGTVTVDQQTMNVQITTGSGPTVGVSSASGTVTNTDISVSGGTTNTKCQGATSPDGSCS